METLTKIWTAIRHNQATIIAIVLCAALGIWIYGCQSTAPSPLTGQNVNAGQIEVDVQTYLAEREAQDKAFAAKAQYAYDEIERQDAVKQALLDMATQYAGSTPIGAFLTPALAILATGMFVSNRKKDSIIVTKNNALEAVSKTSS